MYCFVENLIHSGPWPLFSSQCTLVTWNILSSDRMRASFFVLHSSSQCSLVWYSGMTVISQALGSPEHEPLERPMLQSGGKMCPFKYGQAPLHGADPRLSRRRESDMGEQAFCQVTLLRLHMASVWRKAAL